MKLKKPLFFIAILAISFNAKASSFPSLTTAHFKIAPVNFFPTEEQRILELKWFTSLSTAEYGKLRGKKLNFFEKISFKLTRHRAKQMLKHKSWDEPTILQKISWFLKGILLGPIAVILAYIFCRDDERSLIKWAWFGFATLVIFVCVILLVA